MAKTICPQCSAEFERDGDFCPACGYALAFVKEQEDDVPEEHLERVPGEVVEPTAAEEPAAPTVVIPEIPETHPLEPWPEPEAPTQDLIVLEPPTAFPKRPSSGRARRLMWIALVAAGIILVAAAGIWAIQTGRINLSSSEKGSTHGSRQEPEEGTEPETPAVTPTTSGDVTALDAEESYELLVAAHEALGALAAEVGMAHTDGTYGGTGFAYDVFNRLIGTDDRADRERLAAQCEALLERVSAPRAELESASTAAPYQSQQQSLVSLYRLLERRIQVLLDTAKIAVDRPDEESWRPVLSPLSTELRERFDREYPLAAPSRE